MTGADLVRRLRWLLSRRPRGAKIPPGGTPGQRPTDRYISVDGVDLRYIDQGSGPPVVYLHGAFGMIDELVLSPFYPRLLERYRVIAFDRPGHGQSSRPHARLAGPAAQARLIHQALTQMGITRPLLIGHSWSGALVLAYGLAEPQAVSGLMVLGGWTMPQHQWALTIFHLPKLPVLGEIIARSVIDRVTVGHAAEMMERVFTPNPVPPAFRAYPLSLVLARSRLLANAADIAAMNPDCLRQAWRYPTLSVPIEIVAGAEDRIVDPDHHARPLAARIPGAGLDILPDIGHMPHHSAPDAVLAAVDRLAARARPGQNVSANDHRGPTLLGEPGDALAPPSAPRAARGVFVPALTRATGSLLHRTKSP